MAERKKPHTEVVADNSAAAADPTLEVSKVQAELDDAAFASAIRYIKSAPLSKVQVLCNATYNGLLRLRAKRNPTAAVKGIPKGSDQGDIGSLVTWIGKIQPTDDAAVRQLIVMDATCYAREQ